MTSKLNERLEMKKKMQIHSKKNTVYLNTIKVWQVMNLKSGVAHFKKWNVIKSKNVTR